MSEFGSSEAGKKGGIARAKSLSKKRRSEIAKVAAMARHRRNLPRATHVGELQLGRGDGRWALQAVCAHRKSR